ncbi:MAG TPA: hypothetical protein VFV51_17365 [Vicinamibacterales bacterium]|nr:hypothetical protein [Vicinamibacterales bacterium]
MLLVLIPWSAFWERNYFVDWSPALSAILASNYTRGAVTGLGLLNVWAALAELGDAFSGRRADETNPQSPLNHQQ